MNIYGPANLKLSLSADRTLVHILAVVGFSVCMFGVCWGGAGLAGMVAQVPLSVLLLVLACMSVVLHFFPLKS